MKNTINRGINKILFGIKNKNFEVAKSEYKALKESMLEHNECFKNQMWAIESMIKSYEMYIETYHLLKSKAYYQAWCKAEQIELLVASLRLNNPYIYQYVVDIIDNIYLLQSLYPYKLFASYGIQIDEEKCSICDTVRKIRSNCHHRVGYVYNGHLCKNIVTKCKIHEISLVTNPVHKYAVAFLGSKNGSKDQYDYGIIEALMMYWNKPYQKWNYTVAKKDDIVNISFIFGRSFVISNLCYG